MQKHESMPHLTPFDNAAILAFLESQAGPVMEIDLLRALTGRRRMPASRTELFNLHFSLYHALYLLRDNAAKAGRYLHLDPMRIRLVPLPAEDECHYYDPETGRYCAGRAQGGYCRLHEPDPRDRATLSFDPLREFYVNPANITFGSSSILAKIMDGVIHYALRAGEVERALALFSLTRPNRKAIQKRYHEMARRLHPDYNGGDDTAMKELNRSYQILMEVFVI